MENILEGSVRREGIRVRINAALVKAKDGFQFWSNSYERDLTEVFALQDDIAKAVTVVLKLKLLPGKASLTPRTTPEAYESFLQARYFSHMGDKESMEKSLHYINLAIQSDPSYAAAYAWRAAITLNLGALAWMNYSEAIEEARRDVAKAIDLDPNLPDGYCVLSQIQSVVEANCRAAETTADRALELAPGDADNLGQAAFVATCLGYQEAAVELLSQALALDPLSPGRHLRLAQNLRDLGQYADSEAALKKALDLNPDNIWIHETYGELYLAQGRAQEALEEMEKEPEGGLHDSGLALAYKALGREQECVAVLKKMISLCPNDCAYQIAQVYAYRGEADQAFEWLSRAQRQHDGGLVQVKTDLLLKNIRSDPRYSMLLRSLNLPD